ncbi:unnamed protein product [Owenia fusiformis]|uniref:G-protein coupled receptors family 1 profile domain-containing protein n=1 Tax=Owenia fusiformis TaxID=6347 RepID=A0A8S4N3W6_OWEFU|nr:unnamed protein product [Owenia fusiformis]
MVTCCKLKWYLMAIAVIGRGICTFATEGQANYTETSTIYVNTTEYIDSTMSTNNTETTTSFVNTAQYKDKTISVNNTEATTSKVNTTQFIDDTTLASDSSDTNHTTLEPRGTMGKSRTAMLIPLERSRYDIMTYRAKCENSPVVPIFINETRVVLTSDHFRWLILCVNSVNANKVCAPPFNRISRKYEDYTIMGIVIDIYICIPLCVLGIIGNILSFVTLSREKPNTSIIILKSLAVIDSIYLLLVVVFKPYHIAYHDTEWLNKSSHDEFSHQFEIASSHAAPVINMAQMCSSWLVVLLTIDRFIAICHPFKALTYCTIKRVRVGILSIIVISIVYNIPEFWGISYKWIYHECLKLWMVATGTIRGSIGQHILYRTIYGFAGNLLFRNLLPVVLVVSLNGRLVHSLRVSLQNRDKIMANTEHNNEHRDKNITVTLLTISFVYLICILPMLALSVLDIYFSSVLTNKHSDTLIYYTSDNASFQIYMKFALVVQLLVRLNSAINFLVYCFVRKGFRGKLCSAFKMVVQREGSRQTVSSRYKTSDKSKQSY